MIRTLRALNAEATQQHVTHAEQVTTLSPTPAIHHGMTTRQQSQYDQPRETTPTPAGPATQHSYNLTTPGARTTYGTTYAPETPAARRFEIPYEPQYVPVVTPNLPNLQKAFPDSMKYGDTEESFDLTFRTFKHICAHYGYRTSKAVKEVFHVMLKGQAWNYYWNNNPTWAQLGIDPTAAVKVYFETEEHLRRMQAKWEATNPPKTIEEHPDKTILKCLEIMHKELEKMYHKLRPDLQNEVIYLSKLDAATRLIPACHRASISSTTTVHGFMEWLRKNVTQWEDTKREAAANPEASYVADAYFTNRRYHNRQGPFAAPKSTTI